MIYTSVEQLIGKTPLLELRRLERELGLKARLLAKLEAFNPGGSVKDRVALAMIEDAEARGLLKEGAVIIEPTSGNTGIGLAAVAAARGIRLIIVMPETMSVERRLLMKAYGAELVLTEGAKGMAGAIEKAEALAAEIPGSFVAGQFVNPANPRAHLASTGPELWADAEGRIDVFVAGVGTGGTVSGTGKALKRHKAAVKVVAVEPESSAVLSTGIAGSSSPAARACWPGSPRARRSTRPSSWPGARRTRAGPSSSSCRTRAIGTFLPLCSQSDPRRGAPRRSAKKSTQRNSGSSACFLIVPFIPPASRPGRPG